jgi:NitT/TauT family transport system permease protein
MNTESIKLKIYQFIPIIVFLVVWEIIVRSDNKLTFFFGLPSKILVYLYFSTLDGSLFINLITTFGEAFLGFILGNIIGTLIGLGLWYSKTAFLISRPYIIGLGASPIFALAPLLIIWFGTGIFSKIMIAAISTVFIALSQAYLGASEVKKSHLKMMQTFGATKHQTFVKIIVPSALVWVISAFRMNVGFALLGAFIGEYISSNQGLGHMILVASGLFDISKVLSGVFLLICCAFWLNWMVSLTEYLLKKHIIRNF